MLLDAGARVLDYSPCRYGASKSVFRGPGRDLTRPYVAMLGGSATFGKYVAAPFPALVERVLGQPVANLGALNAGPDFYLSDPATLEVAARAQAAVVQVAGAEGLSNPLYTVHSRRNDRFLMATEALRVLYPQVDFTDIHFTRHLLQVLQRSDAARFRTVVQVLQANWLDRMRALLAQLPRRRLLLWLADVPPPPAADSLDDGPLFIDRAMLDALRANVDAVIEAVPSARAQAMGLLDKTFPETEATQAACLPGEAVHAEVAAYLMPMLRPLL